MMEKDDDDDGDDVCVCDRRMSLTVNGHTAHNFMNIKIFSLL